MQNLYIPILLEYTIHRNTDTAKYNTSITILQYPDDQNKTKKHEANKKQNVCANKYIYNYIYIFQIIKHHDESQDLHNHAFRPVQVP